MKDRFSIRLREWPPAFKNAAGLETWTWGVCLRRVLDYLSTKSVFPMSLRGLLPRTCGIWKAFSMFWYALYVYNLRDKGGGSIGR